VSGDRPSYGGYSSTDETERFSVSDSASPWYLKRWVLALWGLVVVMLIAVIIYGLAVLARGNGGSAPAPTTRTSSTTQSHTTTPSTTPSTTEPTTTTTEATIEPVPPPTGTWTSQRPRHHWRSNLPPMPAVPHF
jgi:cytoskeletal protein RodZ